MAMIRLTFQRFPAALSRATRVAAFPPQPISPASLLGWLTAADTRPGIVILLFLFRYFLSAASPTQRMHRWDASGMHGGAASF